MNCEVPQHIYDLSERTDLKEIERSIIKKYRKELWIPFIDAINQFNLIEDGDKIGVCISGGKDSLLMAKLLQELQKHGKKKFELFFMSMDPGFHEINRQSLERNCDYLGVPTIINNSDIFKVAEKIAGDHPCYMCARMRRGFLYNFAQENGCNKIALGHHYNDVIETTMLNMFYSGNYKTMLPKLKASNFENMELIRPMYYINEENIKKFAQSTRINFMNCGCTVTAKRTSSKRKEVKEIIASIKTLVPDVEKSIMKSASNVHLDSILGYKTDGVYHFYLDEY